MPENRYSNRLDDISFTGAKAPLPTPTKITGFGSKKKENDGSFMAGLSYNPETEEYALGGEVGSKEKALQWVADQRDKVGGFDTIAKTPKGFFPVNEEGKRKISNKLGYLKGVQLNFMNTRGKAFEKLSKIRDNFKGTKEEWDVLSKKYEQVINTEAPITTPGMSATGLGRSAREAIKRDIAAELAGTNIGRAGGAVAGTFVAPGPGTLAGGVAGGYVGSQAARKLVGENRTKDEAYFEAESAGVDMRDPENKRIIDENIELGGKMASAVDAITGGAAGVARKGFVKALIKSGKLTTKKAIEKATLKEAGKVSANKLLKKIESPFIGAGVSSGLEGMAMNQGMTEVSQGRNPTFGESLDSFTEAGIQGLALAGAIGGAGAGAGKATSVAKTKLQTFRNKRHVENFKISEDPAIKGMITAKSIADNTSFEQAKNSLVKEYDGLSKTNIDLANKMLSDHGAYLNKAKQAKKQSDSPKEQARTSSVEETVYARNKMNEEAVKMDKESFGSDRKKTAPKSPEQPLTADETSAFLDIQDPEVFLGALRDSPHGDKNRKSIYNSWVDTHKDVAKAYSLKGKPLSPSQFSKHMMQSVLADGSIKGGDFSAAHRLSTLSHAELKAEALKLNSPTLSSMLDNMRYSDLLKTLQRKKGKISNPEQSLIFIPGIKQSLNLAKPPESRLGKSANSNLNQKNRRAYQKKVMSDFGFDAKYGKDGSLKMSEGDTLKLDSFLEEKLKNIGISYKLLKKGYSNPTYEQRPNGNNGYGVKMGLEAKIDLATTGDAKLKNDMSENSQISNLDEDGNLNQWKKTKFQNIKDTYGEEAPRAVVKGYSQAEKSQIALKKLEGIFNKVRGKLQGVKFGGFTKKTGVEGYINLSRNNSAEIDVVKMAFGFKDSNEKSIKRFFRHELSHKIIEKALSVKEFKMFRKAIREGTGLHKETVKYLQEKRGFKDEQLKGIINDPSEFGAYFLEGAWGNDIALHPRGVVAKAIVALKKFLSDVKNTFKDTEFTNVHQLVAVVQAGQLARDGVIIPGRSLSETKPGPQLKKFTSELPKGDFKDGVEQGVIMDLIHFSKKPITDENNPDFVPKYDIEEDLGEMSLNQDPEMDSRQKAMFDIIYQDKQSMQKYIHGESVKASTAFQKASPVLFAINKVFNQNAVLLSRKYGIVSNVYNFLSKMEQKISLVKNNFDADLKPIMKVFDAETTKADFTSALTEYKNPARNDAGETINPVSKVLNKMNNFVQNGKGFDDTKMSPQEVSFRNIINTIDFKLRNGKTLDIPGEFQTQMLQLSTKVIYNKYSAYTKLGIQNGHQISFGNLMGGDDLDLPPASVDMDTNLFLDTPENMRAQLLGYNEQMTPVQMGGSFKSFEKMSPTMAAMIGISYPLQLSLKLSSLPVNIIGGMVGTFAATQRHGLGPLGILKVFKHYASSATDRSLWTGKGFSGKHAEQKAFANKTGSTGGKNTTFEGVTAGKIRSFGNKKITKALQVSKNILEKSMWATNKGNELQRTSSFTLGLDIAETKGITDKNAQHDFAVNFMNEAAGDFRTFARRASATPAIRFLNQFKSEPQYLAQNLMALGRENPKALAGVLGYLIASMGTAGIPYAEDFFDMMDTIVQQFSDKDSNVKKYMVDALENLTGDRNFGYAMMYGVLAPAAGTRYSFAGSTTMLGLTKLTKEAGKKRPSYSLFDMVPSLGIAAGVFGGSGKDRATKGGTPGRLQAVTRLYTEDGGKTAGENILKILGFSGIDLKEDNFVDATIGNIGEKFDRYN